MGTWDSVSTPILFLEKVGFPKLEHPPFMKFICQYVGGVLFTIVKWKF